jgi:O-antigen ligase
MWLPFFLSGQHVLALIPWELTIALTAAVSLFVLVVWVIRRTRPSEAVTFSLLFLVTMQTIALHAFGPIDLSDVVVIGGVLWLLARRLLDNDRVLLLPSFMWSLPMLACAFLSVTNGGVNSLLGTIIFIKGALLCFLIPNILRERGHVVFFAWALVAVTAASAVFAIIQEIVFLTTGDLLIGFAMDVQSLRHLFEDTSFGRFFRVTALNVSYKHFSFLLLVALLLSVAIQVFDRPTGRARRRLTWAITLIAIALVLTFSKDALLGLAAGLALIVFLRWPLLVAPALGGGALLLAVLVGTGLGDDLMKALSADIHWGESRIRLQLARDGLYGVINQDTWIGRGVNRSARYTHNFNRWVPHNNLIIAAADIGVAGLMAFLVVIGQMIYRLIAACVRATDRQSFALALGLLAGSVAVLISIQFHGLYILTVLWMMLGLTDAFLNTTNWLANSTTRSVRAPP